MIRLICPTSALAKILSSRRGKNISVFQKLRSVYSSPVPPDMRGVTRRHERGAECGGREMCRWTYGTSADGEVVSHAGAKLVTMLTHRAGDGGKCWFTGESSYKP